MVFDVPINTKSIVVMQKKTSFTKLVVDFRTFSLDFFQGPQGFQFTSSSLNVLIP